MAEISSCYRDRISCRWTRLLGLMERPVGTALLLQWGRRSFATEFGAWAKDGAHRTDR